MDIKHKTQGNVVLHVEKHEDGKSYVKMMGDVECRYSFRYWEPIELTPWCPAHVTISTDGYTLFVDGEPVVTLTQNGHLKFRCNTSGELTGIDRRRDGYSA